MTVEQCCTCKKEGEDSQKREGGCKVLPCNVRRKGKWLFPSLIRGLIWGESDGSAAITQGEGLGVVP